MNKSSGSQKRKSRMTVDEIISARLTMTQAEIARQAGISRERVRQILGKAGYSHHRLCYTFRTCEIRHLPKVEIWKYVCIRGCDECWVWSGAKHKFGYGLYKGKSVARLVWEFFRGDIPPGYKIFHDCGKHDCCNPFHLRLGTAAEINIVGNRLRKRNT